MKTVDVPARARSVTNLLRQAGRKGLILRAPNGNCFVLSPIEGWVGFDVGHSRSFAEEVRRTRENAKLMKFLAQRKRRSRAKPISAAKVRKQLGLD